MKRYQEIWTEEVYIIDVIVYRNPSTYEIKDQDNEPITRTFYEQELQGISHQESDSKEKGGRSFIAICKVLYVKVIHINSMNSRLSI